MRKILTVSGVLIAVVLAIAAYVVFNLDSVVKSRIERTGSRVLGVPVTVDVVDISLTGGTARMTDLLIANPPGFSSEPAIRFGEISARVDIASRAIRQVSAMAPVIRVEGSPALTNIDVLRGQVAPAKSPRPSVAKQAGAEDQPVEPPVSAPADQHDAEEVDNEAGTIYTIDRIDVQQATLIVDIEGLESPVQITVDQLVFVDLRGTRSDIARQFTRQLTDRILDEVRAHLAEIGREALRMEVERRVEGLEEKAREKLRSLFD